MEKVIIYGNKAVAHESYYDLKHYSNFEVVGFTVDRNYMEGDQLFGLPVIPFDNVVNVFPPDKHRMFIAVGYVKNNSIRKESYLLAKQLGYQLIKLICPTATVFPEAQLGDNCVIGHYSKISAEVKIGNNVIISSGCIIDHDVVIGDHCFIGDRVTIGGGVSIGACSYLGMGSIIRNRVSIGNECVIGAGALMLESAEDSSVYLGEPARVLAIPSNKLPLA